MSAGTQKTGLYRNGLKANRFLAMGEHFHLCVGVFTVDGKAAGFYGRISPFPRIDARAKDIPLLVEKEDKPNE